MLNSRTIKVVSSFVLVVLLCSSLLGQAVSVTESAERLNPVEKQTQYPSASQGYFDGELDAKGNIAYGCGGFACGVFGFLAAAVSDPQPNPYAMMQLSEQMGPEYTNAYRMAYSKKAKKENMTYAGIGWFAAAALSLVYYMSVASTVE